MAERTRAIAFAFLAACGGSTPRATTLQLSARTHGSTLELELHNTGARRLVGLDGRITVSLARAGQPALGYTFREPSATVDAGATHTESIDLVSAAVRDNAEPPPPGDYELGIAWTDGGQQLTTTTTLTIAGPTEQPCASAPTATGIELLAQQVAATGVVEIGLHNTSDASICVAARVDAGFPQSDWLAIELGTLHALHFVATRHAAVVVTAELPPGATEWSRWDLNEWAMRLLRPLSPGRYSATATYDSASEATPFHGMLHAHFVVTVR
jgi:hypothetical protein